MGKKPEITEMAGLQFFGQISASISHELKNVLAIINENAGLLEDLALMADRGKPIDPERLIKMAATVKRQIGRADGIIKNMNRFAHSADHPVETVDVQVSSGTESTPEVVTLLETGPNTNEFTGLLVTGPGPVVPADGVLQTSHDDLITGRYDDADDGTRAVLPRANVELINA